MPDFSLQPPVAVKGAASFTRERTVRRSLTRWWTPCPRRVVAWLMLNPSDAGERQDDPTMRRVISFSQAWCYDGLEVVNVYPFVASDPRKMWLRAAWDKNGPDWEARDDLQQNLADIEKAARRSCLRMVAFGAAPFHRDEVWLERCLERFAQPFDFPEWVTSWGSGAARGLMPLMSRYSACGRLNCLGTTLLGYPLHPLARGKHRVPDNTQPVTWYRPGRLTLQ